MTHDLRFFSLDVLHFGSGPSRQRIENKHRHHANPTEYFVQKYNAQNYLEGQRDEQHGEIPPVNNVVDIGRNQIGDLPNEVRTLLHFLLLIYFFVFTLLILLDTISVSGGWRGLNMEVVVSFVPSVEWFMVVLSATEAVSGAEGSVGG